MKRTLPGKRLTSSESPATRRSRTSKACVTKTAAEAPRAVDCPPATGLLCFFALWPVRPSDGDFHWDLQSVRDRLRPDPPHAAVCRAVAAGERAAAAPAGAPNPGPAPT